MYKILTGDQVIYDSANKDDYPVTGPGLDPELSQAGSLEFTLLKGHPLLEQMQEMQTFVTAYQDDDCLFYGRVLTADEDLYGGLQVYCEGALTFLLDSELEPVTVTETIAAFFRRCVESHNSQVEPSKQFEVGEVTHEKASTEMEFKIESYITTQNALTSSLTGKHGGFLRVRLEGGKRYLDYIQENTHVNSQPIKVGENIIDKQKHVSGENVFSILRPIGKNKLTIEGASSKNLFSSSSLVSGKKLTAKDTETIVDAEDWCYSPDYMPVTPGATYVFYPAQCRINFYDSAKKCVGTFFTGDEDPDSAAEEAGSNEVTAPAKAVFARMSYPIVYKDRAVFKTPGQNLIGGYVQGEVLGGIFLKEVVTQSDRWCHTEMVSVTPGATYLATPGSVYLNYYEPIEDEGGNPTGEMKVTDTFTPVNDLGGDYITIPSGISLVKISFPSRYTATQRFELASGNLASRSGQVTGKQLNYELGEEIEDDAAWGYTSAYIEVKEDSPYTGSPTPFRMSFYDSKKKPLSGEESESGKTLAWVTSPHDAKYARVSIPLSSQNEFLLQQGKSLIRTHLDAGNKVIELPDRIAKWGRIIHTENFPDIEDAQTLYNAAMDFLNRRVAELPKTCEISLIDLHLLNPEIERVDLGDVFNDIEGFDGPMVAAALHKDLENPKNDTVTFKNVSELAINDAGSSSGSISSSYASSSRSEGYKYKSIREELDEEDSSISKLFLISSRNIELHALEDLWLGTAGKLTLLAKGDDGTYGRVTIDNRMIHMSAENIVHNAHNIYNIADNVVTIADNVYTHANLIWNEAKDIVTIADNIYTVADNVVTIADNVFTHANLIYNQAQDIINNAHNIYNIADNVVTIADNVYTHANLIWNEAKDIVTIADNIYTLADNIVTIADTIYTQANTMTFVAGNVDTVDGTIKKIFGSTIHATAQQLALGNGVFEIDSSGNIYVKDGTALKFRKNGTEYGYWSEDNLTAGVMVSKITGDDSSTAYDVKLGTYINGKLDAGVMVSKITGDNSSSSIGVKLGTFVDDYLDAGVIVSKITGSTSVSMGTYINNQLDAGVMVQKINNDSTARASLGFYDSNNLTAGILVEKINGSTTALKLLGDNIDISANSSITAKVGRSEISINGEVITILSNTINLAGYVKAAQLEAEKAKIDGLIAGTTRVAGLYSTGGITALGFVTAGSYVNSPDVQISGTSLKGAIASFGTATSSGGQISIPTTRIDGTAGPSINFNIAATQFYIDGVAAARNGHSVHSLERITLPSSHTGTATMNNVTVFYEDDDEGTVNVSIDASSVYSAGQTNGANAVRLGATATSSSLSGTMLKVYADLKYNGNTTVNDWVNVDISSYITNPYTLNKGSWSSRSRTVAMKDGTSTIDSVSFSIALPSTANSAAFSSGTTVRLTTNINDNGSSIGTDWVQYDIETLLKNNASLSIGSWSGGSATVTAKINGTTVKTLSVTAPSSTQRVPSSLSSITLGSSDTGTSTQDITVYCSNTDEEFDLTASVNAENVYKAGWIAGYNAAVGKVSIGTGSNTFTVPKATSAYNSTPTQSYTISSDCGVSGQWQYNGSVGLHAWAYARLDGTNISGTASYDNDTLD